jgi:crossover junction endodeoxyribonuclease RuvC
VRILGVDPGTRSTGWGLIGGSVSDPRLLESGRIRLGAENDPLAVRLARLHLEFGELIHRLRPNTSAVESPFHGINARSALQLAHARGVILAALAVAGIDVAEYTPATVKKSVTGNGRAPKPQVDAMVGRLLGRAELIEAGDPADALAVALCHIASRNYLRAVTDWRRPGG